MNKFAIMKFGGTTNYTIIQKFINDSEDQVVEYVNGDVYIMGGAFAFINENNICFYTDGIQYTICLLYTSANHPEILILDDSSSALDYKTDANLRKAILQNLKDTTSIIVTQRVSSVMNADLIIVLEEGEIIGMGNHQDLLNTCEVYKAVSYTHLLL